MTPRPKDGSPWIIPPDEAKGPWIHTETGVRPIAYFFPKNKLREDQVLNDVSGPVLLKV